MHYRGRVLVHRLSSFGLFFPVFSPVAVFYCLQWFVRFSSSVSDKRVLESVAHGLDAQAWPPSRQQIGNEKSRSRSQIPTGQAEIMCVNKLRCYPPPKKDFLSSNRKVRRVSRVDFTHVL